MVKIKHFICSHYTLKSKLSSKNCVLSYHCDHHHCFLQEFIHKWENLTSVLQSSLSTLSETSTLSNKEEADDKEEDTTCLEEGNPSDIYANPFTQCRVNCPERLSITCRRGERKKCWHLIFSQYLPLLTGRECIH